MGKCGISILLLTGLQTLESEDLRPHHFAALVDGLHRLGLVALGVEGDRHGNIFGIGVAAADLIIRKMCAQPFLPIGSRPYFTCLTNLQQQVRRVRADFPEYRPCDDLHGAVRSHGKAVEDVDLGRAATQGLPDGINQDLLLGDLVSAHANGHGLTHIATD